MKRKALFLGYMWKVAEAIKNAESWDLVALGIELQRTNSAEAIRFCEIEDFPFFDARKIRDNQVFRELTENGIDLIVVGAFGQILPADFFALSREGIVNVHTSLLPDYPGGSPIESQIIAGDSSGGITLQWMEEAVDAGDIIVQEEVPILSTDYYQDVYLTYHQKVAALMGELLDQPTSDWPRRPQAGASTTLMPPPKEADGAIDWKLPVDQIEKRIRAFSWRGWCKAYVNGRQIEIRRAKKIERATAAAAAPGSVLSNSDTGMEIQAVDGVLLVEEYLDSDA
jgi:methionyl-tRNA formyltransferase